MTPLIPVPNSPDAPRAMPCGLWLERDQARLCVTASDAGAARVARRSPRPQAAAVTRFLQQARTVCMITATPDGKVLGWNAMAAQCGAAAGADPAGVSVWSLLDPADQDTLRRHLGSGAPDPAAPFPLTLRGLDGRAHKLECRLDRSPAGFVLLGEAAARADDALFDDFVRINNDLSDLTRESARKEHALAKAHAELQTQHEALELANLKIAEIARRDPLTGAYNRRHFDQALDLEITRARRQGEALALFMLDLDHFKSVNDRYGHGVGDAVLVATAATLMATLRAYDTVARFGGEEFVLLFPATDLAAGACCAERARTAIAALQVPGYPHQVTASLGGATLAADDSADTLLRRADAMLYLAKEAGRNRVVVAPTPSP